MAVKHLCNPKGCPLWATEVRGCPFQSLFCTEGETIRMACVFPEIRAHMATLEVVQTDKLPVKEDNSGG
jgi:hypothetical protein